MTPSALHAKSQSTLSKGQNLPQLRTDSVQEKTGTEVDLVSMDISAHPDLVNARRRQAELEEFDSLLRESRRDLEQALSLICQLSSLQNPLKKLFQSLLSTITETSDAQKSKHEIKKRLLINE
jgi:hypothetical protein